MGVLNSTPDSFYAKSRLQEEKQLLHECEKMLTDGASFLDVGGMSSRPGAAIISAEEEIKRVVPAVRGIIQAFPEAIISIDTVRAAVAQAAFEEGALIVNDISAASIDAAIVDVAARHKMPYILMHMQGKPENMQHNPQYQKTVTEDLLNFFTEKIPLFKAKGIHDLVIDLGFGFGKTIEQNYELLKNIAHFQVFDHPILVGISRKSMIYKPLNCLPEEALNGTTALHMVALQNGAKILRTHDVKAAQECLTLYQQLQ